MKQTLSHIILLLMLAIIATTTLAAPMPAIAEPSGKEPGVLDCTVDEEGESDCNCRERHPGYFLSTVIPCIRDEVIAVTDRMTNEFAPYVAGMMGAFLTLVVALFGVKILMAEGDPKKDGFILLVKIGAVMAFIGAYSDLIIYPAFGIMQEGVELTTGVFNITSEYCEPYLSEYPMAEAPWIHYDCVLGKILGFGPGIFVGASAFGLTSAALFSGQFGMIFVMGSVMAIFFLLKLIIRGAYTYLMAVISLGVLIFISPLLIPLIWMPSTQQFFDRWLNAFMSMIIMPAIVMGYLTLSFILLDKIAFDENIGVATLLSKENVQKMQGGKACNKQTLVADPNTTNPGGGVDKSHLESDSQFDYITPVMSGQGNANLFSCFYYADFTSDEVGTIGKLFFSFVALTLVSYILMAMLEQLIQLCQVMLGGGFFMQPAVIGTDGNPFERTLSGVQQNLQGEMGARRNEGAAGMAKAIGSSVSQLPVTIANGLVGHRK